MPKRIGLIKKKFLTIERLILITDHLTQPSKQQEWSNRVRREWKNFYSNFDENIRKIYYELKYQTYIPGEFVSFTKREGNKDRKIDASHVVDQIVDLLYSDCLMYVYTQEKHIIPSTCYGSIPGKGQHQLRQIIINKVKHNESLYAGIADTEKFYPTMDQDILNSFHRLHIKDTWLLWLSELMIGRMPIRGIALGSPSSNINGHIYHAACDWYMIINLRLTHYYRYCDNLYILHHNKDYIHTVMRELIKQTNDLNQKIKPDWRVLWTKDQRFECLGASINSHNARLKRDNRLRIERMMRSRIKSGNPRKAHASWAGVKGSLRDLDVDNLIYYWQDKYADFFDLVNRWDDILRSRRNFKDQHKRLHKKYNEVFTNYEFSDNARESAKAAV